MRSSEVGGLVTQLQQLPDLIEGFIEPAVNRERFLKALDLKVAARYQKTI
jgi:hypothetical protein